MKITFNIGTVWAEVHDLGFFKTSLFLSSLVAGASFWIIAAIVLLDPSYS